MMTFIGFALLMASTAATELAVMPKKEASVNQIEKQWTEGYSAFMLVWAVVAPTFAIIHMHRSFSDIALESLTLTVLFFVLLIWKSVRSAWLLQFGNIALAIWVWTETRNEWF